MIQRKRLVMAGGTLLCALGIGYFMQNSTRPSATQSAQIMASANLASGTIQAAATPTEEKVEVSDVTLASAAPALPEAPDVAALPAEPVVNAALEDTPLAEMPSEEATPKFVCDYELTAKPEAAAMVRLTLNSGCMGNRKFTLHHNGIMFTQVTNADGNADFVVPALSENAVFIVAFGNGEGAVANATVSSLEYYDRAVVQWKVGSGMQVHALEYGAGYGEAGHVWAAAARNETTAALGEGGFLTRLGDSDVDNALLAEVYTFPSGTAKRGGDVTLSVEAEITQANCGRDIEAQSIQKTTDGSLKSQDLVLAMPECDSVGDFLVLKNLLNDLKIAGT